MSNLQKLVDSLAPVREKLIHHPVYSAVNDLGGLQEFAKYHAFAVWDFMSLLKALQARLTCVSVPWVPVGSGQVRYLINEIVAGEESDEAPPKQEGGELRRMSHYELYLEAMTQMGADTAPIQQLLTDIQAGKSVQEALALQTLPDGVRDFVLFTFEVIATNKPHVIAAAFTFGREDLIPGMFIEIVRQLDEANQAVLGTFRFYLERHIELDGDHHSHLAMQMVEELCGDDEVKWQEAAEWTGKALEKRVTLWDAVVERVSVGV